MHLLNGRHEEKNYKKVSLVKMKASTSNPASNNQYTGKDKRRDPKKENLKDIISTIKETEIAEFNYFDHLTRNRTNEPWWYMSWW